MTKALPPPVSSIPLSCRNRQVSSYTGIGNNEKTYDFAIRRLNLLPLIGFFALLFLDFNTKELETYSGNLVIPALALRHRLLGRRKGSWEESQFKSVPRGGEKGPRNWKDRFPCKLDVIEKPSDPTYFSPQNGTQFSNSLPGF